MPVLLALLHPAALPRRPAHYRQRDHSQRDGRVRGGGGRARVAPLHPAQRPPLGRGRHLLGEYLALGRQDQQAVGFNVLEIWIYSVLSGSGRIRNYLQDPDP